MSTVKEQLEGMIADNNILLFMKGDPHQPQCGFSAKVVNVLKEYKIEFSYMDILQDPDIRATLPSVSDWPTFPQLFVKGELIGGCDIITEMHSAGELKEVLVD
jgi:monothiol glutaredoxin|tara:strand:- start:156 stop:464 length:309 start_codon:yes stop_codon:yes gene_type:complete